MDLIFPEEFIGDKIKLLVGNEIIEKRVDDRGIITFNKNGLVKKILKDGVKLID